jgi:hypothetical protein
MARQFEHDPAVQLHREIKDEIYRDAGFSLAAQGAAMRTATQLVEADRPAATDPQRRSEVESDAAAATQLTPCTASTSGPTNIRRDVDKCVAVAYGI